MIIPALSRFMCHYPSFPALLFSFSLALSLCLSLSLATRPPSWDGARPFLCLRVAAPRQPGAAIVTTAVAVIGPSGNPWTVRPLMSCASQNGFVGLGLFTQARARVRMCPRVFRFAFPFPVFERRIASSRISRSPEGRPLVAGFGLQILVSFLARPALASLQAAAPLHPSQLRRPGALHLRA